MPKRGLGCGVLRGGMLDGMEFGGGGPNWEFALLMVQIITSFISVDYEGFDKNPLFFNRKALATLLMGGGI
jgi:hypothetical protein